MSNPFERYDIDPMQGPAAITERLRELTEEADETEREALRAVWEELTMHPVRRLEIALEAFPETRPTIAGSRKTSPIPDFEGDAPLTLRELAVIPRVAEALGPGEPAAVDLLPAISADPFIDPPHRSK